MPAAASAGTAAARKASASFRLASRFSPWKLSSSVDLELAACEAGLGLGLMTILRRPGAVLGAVSVLSEPAAHAGAAKGVRGFREGGAGVVTTMVNPLSMENQLTIWTYYKPRHTHAWNMLVLSHRALEDFYESEEDPFKLEYLWENFIIRLWLYRITVSTLSKIQALEMEAKSSLASFDSCFKADGAHALQAIRNMIEHFDDYAADMGRGPARRDNELDPWREVSRDRFERGRFAIERASAYDAAIRLRSDAKSASDAFIAHYNASR